jgi:pimeloyl-ACP methyl ester carboxylesterase
MSAPSRAAWVTYPHGLRVCDQGGRRSCAGDDDSGRRRLAVVDYLRNIGDKEKTSEKLIDNITIACLTNTAISGARLYWEYWGNGYFNAKGVSIPAAVSVFPDELYPAPHSWAEQAYPKLIHYNRLPKGGHFAAFEQPKFLSEEMRAGFRSLRT